MMLASDTNSDPAFQLDPGMRTGQFVLVVGAPWFVTRDTVKRL
jgi:hypothetical protein